MNTVSPKADFLEFDADYATEARKQLPQVWFRKASNAALAEMAHLGASKEELAGAARYLNSLINIAEKPTEPLRLPVKTLTELNP